MFSFETKQNLRQVLMHPMESAWRLVRALNRDDMVESYRLLHNLAVGLPDRLAGDYREELDFLISRPFAGIDMFPYPEIAPSPRVDSGWDKNVRLPYVVHEGRRFYGMRRSTVDQAVKSYLYFVATEGILGTGIRSKSPHAYVDAGFKVEAGDVVVDIGCSDGLFAFANAEYASQIYLFETDKLWMEPLHRSFEPYKGKVSVVNKFVAGETCGIKIKLIDALGDTGANGRFFIKMDIEGGERDVIASSEDFFKANRVKLSCCVYHRQDDAVVIRGMLEKMGFRTRFSDGYMLTALSGMQCPYFRKGVVYAQNY